ncbi:hypothetical protein D3C81_1607720 [compost metagenome]
MSKSKWKYVGFVGLVLLLIVSTSVWFIHFKLEHEQGKEATERKEMEQLLRAKEKQVDFYFNIVNELVYELDEVKMSNNPQKDIVNSLVWESLESEEYKTILANYEEHYGFIDEYFIPKNETLSGLRYKVEESIAEGYDMLPLYYGWTNVLMSIDTKEFRELNALYKEHFGDGIPTEMIGGTTEELIEIVNKSVKENRNLLPEYFGWDYDNDY